MWEALYICVLEANSKEGQLERVCIFRNYYCIDNYAKLEIKCCNPFNICKKAIKNSRLHFENFVKNKTKDSKSWDIGWQSPFFWSVYMKLPYMLILLDNGIGGSCFSVDYL